MGTFPLTGLASQGDSQDRDGEDTATEGGGGDAQEGWPEQAMTIEEAF